MSKPYDATPKHLEEVFPQDWGLFLGVKQRVPVTVVDADVSTVTAAADKVLRVDEPNPYILHVEFQANYDATLSQRLLHYNVILGVRHSLPVRSVVILLRREADGKTMTGHVQGKLASGKAYLEFEYEVVRLWELSPEAILAGGIGTLPLLPLTKVSRSRLPRLILEMEKRFERDAERADIDMLWTATYVLMGLEYEEGFARQMLQGVRSMKESVTYQAILEEGRVQGVVVGREEGRQEGRQEGREEGRADEARRILLSLGTKRFGKPPVKVRRRIALLADSAVLEGLATRLLDVESWADLLAGL